MDEIKLKPLSEGLGLNHFADGLPYTPTNSKRKPTVNFNYPPPRSPNPSMAQGMTQASVGSKVAQDMIRAFEAAAPQPEPESANFLRRMIAYAIDVFLSSAMFAVIVWASFSLNGYDIGQLLIERRGFQMIWPLALLYIVVHLGYFLIQETTWRRTLGKSMMGIRIEANSGFATLGRTVCFFIAAIPFGIGLIWYFFDSKHRCWHDVITDSAVVTNADPAL